MKVKHCLISVLIKVYKSQAVISSWWSMESHEISVPSPMIFVMISSYHVNHGERLNWATVWRDIYLFVLLWDILPSAAFYAMWPALRQRSNALKKKIYINTRVKHAVNQEQNKMKNTPRAVNLKDMNYQHVLCNLPCFTNQGLTIRETLYSSLFKFSNEIDIVLSALTDGTIWQGRHCSFFFFFHNW